MTVITKLHIEAPRAAKIRCFEKEEKPAKRFGFRSFGAEVARRRPIRMQQFPQRRRRSDIGLIIRYAAAPLTREVQTGGDKSKTR